MLKEKNILVVDDSDINLVMISEMLELEGYSTFVANSGKLALAFLEDNTPDLILLDISMPDMNGFEVCEKIKENKNLSEIPLLFLTASYEKKNKLKGFELGAVDFISKPFEQEELFARINTHLTLQENKLKLIQKNEELIQSKKDTSISEEKYRSLFNSLLYSSALHKIVLDKNEVAIDYIYIEVNDAFEKQTGLKRENIVEKRATEVFPGIENDPIGWIEIYGKVAITGEPVQFEYFLESFNKWYSVVAYSSKKGFFTTRFEDITELKQVEENKIKLAEEQKKLYEKREKQRIANLVILNDLNNTTKDLKAEIVERNRTDQIQKILYNISNAVITSSNLKKLIQGIQIELGTIIDTTNFYVALYEKKTDMFSLPFVVDEKVDITSFPAGKTLTNYVLKTKKPLLANQERMKDLKKTQHIEQLGTDSEIWLGVPLKIEKEVIGVLAVQSYTNEFAYNESDLKILEFISHQISLSIHRKKAEEELIKYRNHLEEVVEDRTKELIAANTELSKAAKMKDEFLANMSHELRTPLNAVLGLSEALQEEIYGRLNKKQSEKIQYIEESGRHLLSLINEILDLAKIEAGKITLEYGQISLKELLESSLRFVKQIAFKKKIKISTTILKTLETFQADEKRMKQILVNLLSNAVKFTPDDGQVNIEVKANKKNQTISFKICDTGIGISKKNISKLFQPFVQIDSALSRQYEGTGLGLALVDRLVSMHKGTVRVKSKVGEGSCFIVTIPYILGKSEVLDPYENKILSENSESDNLIENVDTQVEKKSKGLILLAEDNDLNITTIKDYLEAKQFSIIVARNGEIAVEMAKEVKPDIILMDIQMPVMNGLEATKEIRASKNAEISGIPIIALTSLAMPADIEKCMSVGANKYMSKPVSLKELVININEYLDN